MLRSGLRRLAILFVVIFVLTSVISLAIGALAHGDLRRSVADGFYIAGAAMLVCSFIFGLRGPLRGDWGDTQDPTQALAQATRMPPRKIRRTTFDERADARRSSLGFFALGFVLIMIGAAFDPSRNAF